MLEDKDIEKRMMDALGIGGRQSIDDLARSTGIDKERIVRALLALEAQESIHHITLEGTSRFYATAANLKDGPVMVERRKVRMYHSPPKQPCPKCGRMCGPTGMSRHIKACKGSVLGKPTPIKEVKPPLVLEGPAITTTGNMETSWNVGHGIGEVVPSGEKEVEDKIAETMEELGKVSQYNHVRCPRCGTKWKLILTLTYKSPTALLVECPFCRT
jgi:DNA-binding Lrp family transcriptional regulator